MTIRKLPTMEEKIKALPTEKPARNKAEFSVVNGLYFGVGFWLAFVGVVFIASPVVACAVYIVLAIR